MTDLYLDTEITDVTIAHVARVCAASPYSARELERIMFCEVWPAFIPNLLTVAGEWAGWSEAFVQRRVLDCYKPRWYFSWRIHPIKRFYCREWSTVATHVARARSAGA